jgi:hypothetical protein
LRRARKQRLLPYLVRIVEADQILGVGAIIAPRFLVTCNHMFSQERSQPGQEWIVSRAIDDVPLRAVICVFNRTLDFVLMRLSEGVPNLLADGTPPPHIKTDVDQDTHVLTMVN